MIQECVPPTLYACLYVTMDSKSCLKKYTFADDTFKRLEEIKVVVKKDDLQANPAWKVCFYREAATLDNDEEDSERKADSQSSFAQSEEITTQMTQSLATQYFYSQREENTLKDSHSIKDSLQISDIIESVCESLERQNGKFIVDYIQRLSDAQVLVIINDLRERLTSRGIYNLCRSICAMEIEQRIKYIGVVCSNLLLQRLIDLKEPSRLIITGINECVEKFPEEIQQLIFVPLLRADLKDTTAILAIVNSFGTQRQLVLLSDFLGTVRELKQWHVLILQALLMPNADESAKNKLMRLLVGKSLAFSKDKNFGKFVLNFLKTSAPFSEEQKSILWEIVTVNETLFKRPMENILKNM